MQEMMSELWIFCALFLVVVAAAPQQQQQQPSPQEFHGNNKVQLQNQGLSPNQQPNLNVDQPMAAAASSYDGYSSNFGGNYESNDNYNYGFDCYGKKPAFYGDSNYDCKVYHVCQADGRSDSFRCPKWTRFNNYLGICDWHFKVDSYCNPLENSYGSNSYGNSGGSGYSGGSGGSGGY